MDVKLTLKVESRSVQTEPEAAEKCFRVVKGSTLPLQIGGQEEQMFSCNGDGEMMSQISSKNPLTLESLQLQPSSPPPVPTLKITSHHQRGSPIFDHHITPNDL